MIRGAFNAGLAVAAVALAILWFAMMLTIALPLIGIGHAMRTVGTYVAGAGYWFRSVWQTTGETFDKWVFEKTNSP